MATTQSTHTEVPGKPGFPPFQRDTFASQLFWLVVTFVLLYVVVARVALPRVGATIDARRTRIDGDLSQANSLKVEAGEQMAAYEKALSEARTRAQTIAGETRDRLNVEAEKRRKALDDALNTKLAEADKAIAVTKERAMSNVRGIAADAASAIVAKLTGVTPAEGAVANAVDAVLKR